MKKICKRTDDILKKFNLHFTANFVNRTRPAVKFIKMLRNNEELTGVEIGVYYGVNSSFILKHLNMKKLYLVDPYDNYDDYNEVLDKVTNMTKAEKIMRKTLNFNKNKDKLVLIKKFSSKAITDIPNNLDFVYIDGNHSYKYVMEDMEIYYKKLKQGGVLCGHDFTSYEIPEVCNAVMDFMKKENLQLYTEGVDWWAIKGRKRQANLNNPNIPYIDFLLGHKKLKKSSKTKI